MANTITTSETETLPRGSTLGVIKTLNGGEVPVLAQLNSAKNWGELESDLVPFAEMTLDNDTTAATVQSGKKALEKPLPFNEQATLARFGNGIDNLVDKLYTKAEQGVAHTSAEANTYSEALSKVSEQALQQIKNRVDEAEVKTNIRAGLVSALTDIHGFSADFPEKFARSQGSTRLPVPQVQPVAQPG